MCVAVEFSTDLFTLTLIAYMLCAIKINWSTSYRPKVYGCIITTAYRNNMWCFTVFCMVTTQPFHIPFILKQRGLCYFYLFLLLMVPNPVGEI